MTIANGCWDHGGTSFPGIFALESAIDEPLTMQRNGVEKSSAEGVNRGEFTGFSLAGIAAST
jgi:hypothetical protein